MGNTLTVRETAVLLDTDLSYTYHLIHAGKLLAEQVNGRWAVDMDAAFTMAQARRAKKQRKALKEQRRAERRARLEETRLPPLFRPRSPTFKTGQVVYPTAG